MGLWDAITVIVLGYNVVPHEAARIPHWTQLNGHHQWWCKVAVHICTIKLAPLQLTTPQMVQCCTATVTSATIVI